MDKEVWLIALVTVWAILKLMNHKVFMYQRTIRKFRLKGIELTNENNLYPLSYNALLRISWLRYIALGAILYLNIWGGVVCVVLGQLLAIFTPEQDDWDNLQIALKSLHERQNKKLVKYMDAMKDRSLVLEVSREIEDANLKIKDIFRLYDEKDCLELVEQFSELGYWREAEFYCMTEDIVRIDEGDVEERRPFYAWMNHVSIKMADCMRMNFRTLKDNLFNDWGKQYKNSITEHQAAYILRFVISMGAKAIVEKQNKEYEMPSLRNTKYEQGEVLTFVMNGVRQRAEITGITPEGDYVVQIEQRVEGINKNIVDVYTEEEIDRYVKMAERKKSLDRMKDLGYLDSNYHPTRKMDIQNEAKSVEFYK